MSGGKVIVITGPTATGKSKLGVMLARDLRGEIVSADSMQIYKYMDIGTAKPTPEEMGGVPHHMIDCVSPFEPYSVSLYVRDAAKCCEDILRRGKTPVIVGGTGLYIESLISGRDFCAAPEDRKLREELSRDYDETGGEAMLQRLSKYDPDRAQKLHPNDKKRVVRALEIALAGERISEHDRRTQESAPRFDAKFIVLGCQNRQDLYDRIDGRVDGMMEAGLVREVQSLLDMGLTPGHTSMQAIGYKEICEALEGRTTLPEAVETVKRQSRRYAKRQISWCGRYQGALRIDFEKTPDFEKARRISTEFLSQSV